MRVTLIAAHYGTPAIASRRSEAMARHLAKMGWQVDVVTVATEGGKTVSPDQRIRVQWIADPKSSFHSLVQRFLNKFLIPDHAVVWSIAALFSARVRGDVILVSGPPFSSFFLAAILAARTGTPWVADYRDLWTLSGYYPYGRPRRFFESRVEKLLMSTADSAVSVSSVLSEELCREFRLRTVEVRNGFEPKDFVGLEPYRRLDGPVRFVYCGEIYPGKRDPSPLFRAAFELGLRDNDVRFEFYGGSVGPIKDLAIAEGVNNLVEVGSRVSHRDSLQLQAGADVLLLLTWDSPEERGVFGGKIFEYLATGRPILLLGYSQGVAAELIRTSGLGWVAGSSDAKDALERVLVEFAAFQNDDGRATELFSYGVQMRTLDRSLRAAVQKGSED